VKCAPPPRPQGAHPYRRPRHTPDSMMDQVWEYTWGERVGEATNPGPSNTNGAAPLDVPQNRWVRREVASTCPQCEARLLDTAGRVYNISTDRTVAQGKRMLSCCACSPQCVATMAATDPKYTCTTCGLDYCHPCTEGTVTESNRRPDRTQTAVARSSTSGSNAPRCFHCQP
jgi:hypothetical protein